MLPATITRQEQFIEPYDLKSQRLGDRWFVFYQTIHRFKSLNGDDGLVNARTEADAVAICSSTCSKTESSHSPWKQRRKRGAHARTCRLDVIVFAPRFDYALDSTPRFHRKHHNNRCSAHFEGINLYQRQYMKYVHSTFFPCRVNN